MWLSNHREVIAWNDVDVNASGCQFVPSFQMTRLVILFGTKQRDASLKLSRPVATHGVRVGFEDVEQFAKFDQRHVGWHETRPSRVYPYLAKLCHLRKRSHLFDGCAEV